MKIAIVGLGYVGHALGEFLCKSNDVFGYDIDNSKCLNNSFLCGDKIDYQKYDMAILCLPTNFNVEKKELDTSIVSREIGTILRQNENIDIYIKSTVNIGFSRQISRYFKTKHIFYVPEFMREKSADDDIKNPDRIVIGTNAKSSKGIKNYLSLFDEKTPSVITGFDEAEAIKLFSNSYLANRVAFFNEIDTYCDTHNLDSKAIIEGVCLDHRIGNNYNRVSFGFGGYCLPKDTKALSHLLSRNESHLIKATIKSNYYRKRHIVKQIIKEVKGISNPLVGIYKLGYRNSPLDDIIYMLAKKDIGVLLYDENIKDEFYLNALVINNLDEFKEKSSLIVSECIDSNLDDVKDKVFIK